MWCGTGWLTWLLARCGYDAVGQDVSERAIELATAQPSPAGAPQPGFVSGDFEQLGYEAEFDAVVFFDSLHHAEDEERAIRAAWRALKPGGLLVASEPGAGHAKASRAVARKYDVTDKDMPPSRIVRLGRRSGFSKARVYPHADCLGGAVYGRRFLAGLARAMWHLLFRRRNGITVLVKPG